MDRHHTQPRTECGVGLGSYVDGVETHGKVGVYCKVSDADALLWNLGRRRVYVLNGRMPEWIEVELRLLLHNASPTSEYEYIRCII